MTWEELLDEELIGAASSGIHTKKSHVYNIYKNPTKVELYKAGKETKGTYGYGIRFFIDLQKGDVYAFNDNCMHFDAIQEVYGTTKQKVFRGYADVNGNINGAEFKYFDDDLDEQNLLNQKDKIIKFIKKSNIGFGVS